MKRALIAIACIALLTALGLYIRQLIHETVESPVARRTYVVGLGDSVAAGAGLNNDRRPDCDLSDKAFPYLVGSQFSTSVEQFACSGATVAPGTNSLQNQYLAALPFLRGSDVLVYAGANDIGWLKLLTSCAQENCATAENRAQIASKLTTLQTNLAKLLIQIQQARPRRLLVHTYYNLLAPGDTCVARLGITTDKVSFINEEESLLNAAIAASAAEAKATLVSVNFGGHTLCSPQSWIQGISGPAPLHPTAAGQQHIAQQDAAALGSK